MTGSKKPWWQVTSTPKYGFALATLWAVMAAFEWVSASAGDGWGGKAWRVILASLMTLLAAVYLVSTVSLHRKQRKERDG